MTEAVGDDGSDGSVEELSFGPFAQSGSAGSLISVATAVTTVAHSAISCHEQYHSLLGSRPCDFRACKSDRRSNSAEPKEEKKEPWISAEERKEQNYWKEEKDRLYHESQQELKQAAWDKLCGKNESAGEHLQLALEKDAEALKAQFKENEFYRPLEERTGESSVARREQQAKDQMEAQDELARRDQLEQNETYVAVREDNRNYRDDYGRHDNGLDERR